MGSHKKVISCGGRTTLEWGTLKTVSDHYFFGSFTRGFPGVQTIRQLFALMILHFSQGGGGSGFSPLTLQKEKRKDKNIMDKQQSLQFQTI